MNFSFKQLKRFWSKVNRTKNGCWEWAGSTHKGYGEIRLNNKTWRAHILSYRLFNTDYKQGLCVRHKCDNPGCVNPKHLELGTTQQNTQDRVDRGRSAIGSRNGKAKLTAEDVLEIRELYTTGNYTHKQLAEQFNIGRNGIWSILNRRTWRHI